jgi:hypothetical protein
MPADIKAAVAIIRQLIRAQRPDGWWFAGQDMVGHGINVHYDDGEYAATVNYETYEWNSYDFMDAINDALEAARLPLEAEYLSDYEIALVRS